MRGSPALAASARAGRDAGQGVAVPVARRAHEGREVRRHPRREEEPTRGAPFVRTRSSEVDRADPVHLDVDESGGEDHVTDDARATRGVVATGRGHDAVLEREPGAVRAGDDGATHGAGRRAATAAWPTRAACGARGGRSRCATGGAR